MAAASAAGAERCANAPPGADWAPDDWACERRRRYSSMPPGKWRSRPLRIAYCWSVTRSRKYRS
ncbi:MAG: hypothetical protein ACRDP7_06600, partial [Trebonia sp.]